MVFGAAIHRPGLCLMMQCISGSPAGQSLFVHCINPFPCLPIHVLVRGDRSSFLFPLPCHLLNTNSIPSRSADPVTSLRWDRSGGMLAIGYGSGSTDIWNTSPRRKVSSGHAGGSSLTAWQAPGSREPGPQDTVQCCAYLCGLVQLHEHEAAHYHVFVPAGVHALLNLQAWKVQAVRILQNGRTVQCQKKRSPAESSASKCTLTPCR